LSIDLPPERRRYVLYACMASIFTAAVEGTIVATALPSIVTDLGGFSLFSWVFAAYMLTQAVTIPIYGRLADLYGRRTVIFAGLALFLVASGLCGFARTMLQLVLFRALQGLGAGAILPIAMTIIGDMYPAVERARIQPYVATVFASSSIAGPILGAFIVGNMGWPVIFWINVPVCIIAFLMLLIFLKEHPKKVEHTIDLAGAALLMLAIALLLLPLLEAEVLRWWIIPLVLASVACFVLFLRQERASPEPLLPVELWRDPALRAGNLGSSAIGATVMGMSAFLPTYLQAVMGRSVLDAGVMLGIMSLTWPASSILGTRLTLWTSYRTAAMAGAALATLGSLLMPAAAILSGDGAIPIFGAWWPAAAAALVGAGLGMCNPSFMVAVQECAGPATRGAATAAYNFMRMLGATFGTALLGAAFNLSLAMRLPGERNPVQTLMDTDKHAGLAAGELSRLSHAVAGALHDVFWTTAALAFMGVIIARMMPRGIKPGHKATPLPVESAAADHP
jgi:EmrB/QacA subfamily drug resistance transporter